MSLSSASVDPVWFVPMVPVVWFLGTGLLARISGWASLATQFRSRQPSTGETFRFASGSMGARAFPVRYHGCLTVVVGAAGIGLSVLFLFRFQSPPLFIPWSEVESVERKKVLFWRYVVLRLRHQWPVIAIQGPAGQRIAETHAALHASPGRGADGAASRGMRRGILAAEVRNRR